MSKTVVKVYNQKELKVAIQLFNLMFPNNEKPVGAVNYNTTKPYMEHKAKDVDKNDFPRYVDGHDQGRVDFSMDTALESESVISLYSFASLFQVVNNYYYLYVTNSVQATVINTMTDWMNKPHSIEDVKEKGVYSFWGNEFNTFLSDATVDGYKDNPAYKFKNFIKEHVKFAGDVDDFA